MPLEPDRDVAAMEPDLITEDNDEDSYVAPDDIPLSERRLSTQPVDWPIRTLVDMVHEGSLDLQPMFQRRYVWDDGKASRLVESVLMNVPLPVIYLAEEEPGQYSVIDGQQRIRSLVRFISGEFALRKLTVRGDLNRKKFAQLERGDQGSIRSRTVRCVVITRESHPDIKFEIFERLNSGAVQLNSQELRNSIFRGDLNELLKELAHNENWLRCVGRRAPDARMKDCEMILRFFALYHRYNQYRTPLKTFLNSFMSDNGKMSSSDKEQLTELFKKTISNVLSVFGDRAFRRYRRGTPSEPNAGWEDNVNTALFDAVMVQFAVYEPRELIPAADAIREGLIELLTEDREFQDAINDSTADRTRVRTRVHKWESKLRGIIEASAADRRVFSPSFREALYDQDSTCSLCGQRIILLDDAVVDHQLPWSVGGPTTPSNGRLAHRYCNSSRGARSNGA